MRRTSRVGVLGALTVLLTMAIGSPTVSAASRAVLRVRAAHATLPATGTTTDRLTVTAVVDGVDDANVPVSITLAPRPGDACGSIAVGTGRTSRSGALRVSYQSSSTVGFCTAVATVGHAAGRVTLVQTSPAASGRYHVTLASRSDSLHPGGITMLKVTVVNDSTPVSDDPVMITATALRPGACGTVTPDTVATGSTGELYASYTGSRGVGSCRLTATEAVGGAVSNSVVVYESSLPA